MQQNKIKVDKYIRIDLNDIPQTSLMPLYARAKISREYSSLFNDAKAVELVERIDYDFSAFVDKAVVDYVLFTTVARAKQFDDKIRTCTSRNTPVRR